MYYRIMSKVLQQLGTSCLPGYQLFHWANKPMTPSFAGNMVFRGVLQAESCFKGSLWVSDWLWISPLARASWRAFLNLQSKLEYLPSNYVCIGWEASHMGQITQTGCGTPRSAPTGVSWRAFSQPSEQVGVPSLKPCFTCKGSCWVLVE